MINVLFYLNPEKLLQFEFRPIDDEEDDDDEIEGIGLNVEVIENGQYVTYHFADPESLDDFIESLEDRGIDYVLVDDDGDAIGWDWDDYNGDDYEDDEY